MTLPEVLLWTMLRQRPAGLKFRRQHPIGPYVADFCCMAARVVVEVDGTAHDMGGRPDHDARRTRYIEEHGFRVIRVPAAQVLDDVADAAAAIVALVEGPLHRPADGPPPRAGED